MFLDARTLPGGERLAADICIVGAGPAGIALATALSVPGHRVLVAESGGLESDPATEALNEGETVGLGYKLAESRLRYFGGAGNHWAGNCRPLDTSVFPPRDWIPDSGWPFTRAELDPYYGKARVLCGVRQAEATPADIRAAGGAPVAWSEPLENAVWQVPPVKPFGERFHSTLAHAAGVTVLLNANLVQLVDSHDGESIALAHFATLTGVRFAASARCYVLACGGVENARLLLAMPSERYPFGLGNRHDLVGRYFTEHPEISVGALVHDRPSPRGLGRVISTPEEQLLEGFRLTDSIQRTERVADVAFWPLSTVEAGTSSGPPTEFADVVQDVSSRLAGLAADGPRMRTALTVTLEQTPNPASRITLSDARDALGIPRVRLDWRMSDLDRRTFAVALKTIAREAGRQRIGRFLLREALRSIDVNSPKSVRFDLPLSQPSVAHNQLDTVLGWGCHHMGTTRMHADACRGVVDRHSRVHGVANLYIAGPSTFPSVGISNPMLTIVALALRLADHLLATATT